ncbi:MAG: hypothetical protein BGO43_05345 [Gammaproteobacteria bacterium 39-13]|nr:patatin-like phospholipase family protein [Gammaproteobacteria bacterium]OJV96265.1 MAG: hypothetical protein BGO43_05345 [Gammaproteobacteria bacterium 39-13]
MKKLVIILVLIIANTNAVFAEERRPKVGLVLSGGGARGAAHIGVIEALEELDVPIDIIVGTSMGAVIGGLYAAGASIDDIKYNFTKLNWEHIFNIQINRDFLYYRRKQDDDIFLLKNFISYSDGSFHLPWGIVTGQNLYQFFNSYLLSQEPIDDFTQLKYPFKAVSTDLVTGKAVVLDKGDLALSMLASMAVPGIINPVDMGDYLLVDGGVSANLPIQIAREMGADIIIAVDVSTPLSTKNQINDLADSLNQLTNILTHNNIVVSKSSLTSQDILIEPKLGNLGTSDFDKFKEGIRPGIEATYLHRDRLQQLSSSSAVYNTCLLSKTLIRVDDIQIKKEHFLRPETYHHYLDFDKTYITTDELTNHISYLYGLDIYERIYYGIEYDKNENVLVVEPHLKSENPLYVQGSLFIDTDFQTNNSFGLAIGFTNPQVNSLLGEWRIIGKIGQGTGIFAEFYQPLESSLSWFINPYINLQRLPRPIYFDYTNLATVLDSSAQVGVLFGRNFSNVARLSAFWLFEYDGYDVKEGTLFLPENHSQNGEMGLTFEWDTVDNIYFPHHGLRGEAKFTSNEKAFGGKSHFSQFASRGLCGFSSGKHALALAGIYNKTLDGELELNSQFSLGGLFELTGLANNELMGNNAGLLTGIYFYEIKKLSLIPNRPSPVYAGASLERGKVWGDTNLGDNKFISSGSLFLGIDSLIGPIYLAFGMTDNGRKAAHLVIRPAFR